MNKTPRWGQERRSEFIEFRLQWEGKINRAELAEFFGISMQQASLDFASYMVAAEGNMEYDKSEKLYRASPDFSPKFLARDSQPFLNQLAALALGMLAPSSSFIGNRPPCDVVTVPTRRVRLEYLLPVLWSIRDKCDLEITYQSMRRPDATARWVAPHALAFDGGRWHMRAWCYESSSFRDFVLTRILRIGGTRKSSVDSINDADWHSNEVVVIKPKDELSQAQRDAVITEFDMRNGCLTITLRRALVLYFIRLLQVDGPNASHTAHFLGKS